ncbi:transglycosylase domain-containing protein [Candidatus Woesebacteria bacterium]|nr:transglycosylase domain-containing protein [Candidatus Woesebacteria bacterium]
MGKKKFKFKYKSKIKKIIFLILLSLTVFLVVWLSWGVPLPTKLSSIDYPVSTKILDRNGKLIYEIFADKRRTPVKLSELPDYVKQSTIAIEDKDFYNHHGFSLTGITRAIYNTLFRKKLQGGSTLTQQLVKNVLLTPERTLKRKIREFALTIIVETIYSKDQILEMYLNQIPYGSTSYGIESASELYFGKPAKELTLPEAALLAGLPASPTHYSPFGARPEEAKRRQDIVLRRMVEDGYIDREDADRAKEEKLDYAKPEAPKAAHFALWVKEQMVEKYGQVVTEQGGLRVTTTLDLDLQEFTQNAVATEVAKLKKQKVGNGAALVTRPQTGEILAMVGSYNYFAEDEDGKVNIILSRRQPGSSIKPINYALAIRDKKITPSSALADVPTCFSVVGQPLYCPSNYDGAFHGLVQARFALGNSYNIPAVRVLALNGVEGFIEFARLMGITTFTDPANYGLSITLGGGEVKPFDMATAFGVFANQGIKIPLTSILKVEDWKGKVLEEVKVGEIEGDRILEPDVTFLISHILLDNNARSSAFGEGSFLNVRGHPEVSVKTGTTNDRRDNWTIGYTKDALVVSWVGNNDNSPMSGAVSGVSGASPIWNRVMKETLDKYESEGHSWPRQSEEVVGRSVCWTTGLTAPGDQNNPGCSARFEYFLKDNIPTTDTGSREDIVIDKTTGAIARPDTPPESIETQNHPVIRDPLGTLFCLDCPIPTQPVTIRYPLSIN